MGGRQYNAETSSGRECSRDCTFDFPDFWTAYCLLLSFVQQAPMAGVLRLRVCRHKAGKRPTNNRQCSGADPRIPRSRTAARRTTCRAFEHFSASRRHAGDHVTRPCHGLAAPGRVCSPLCCREAAWCDEAEPPAPSLDGGEDRDSEGGSLRDRAELRLSFRGLVRRPPNRSKPIIPIRPRARRRYKQLGGVLAIILLVVSPQKRASVSRQR